MRVVVVSPHPVHPADSGDRLRTSQLLDGLRARGVDATLVAWSWSGQPEGSPWPSRFIAGKPRDPARWLAWRLRFSRARGDDPWAEYTMAQRAAPLSEVVRSLAPDVVDFQHSYTWTPLELPNVCTFHNIESDLVATRAGVSREGVAAVHAREARALREANASVVFSDEDARRAHAIAPGAPVSVVPIGHRPPENVFKHTQAPKLRTAVFVGTMDYEPNTRAAQSLVRLWPDLQRAGIERLLIVGRRADRVVATRDGIEVFADVPSVVPYLLEADVTLVPLTEGGGVRVKVIEAFALGLPVVATRIGIEGLGAVDGEHAMIVESPDELPAAVTAIAPATARSRLAQNALQLWRDRYSPEKMVDSMLEVYERALTRAELGSSASNSSSEDGGVAVT